MTVRSALLTFVVAAALGCATGGLSGSGGFRVECNLPEAIVVVDDVVIGKVSEWSAPGRMLRPGFHRVEVRYPGYYSHYAEVDLPDGGTVVVVKADLRPLL